MKNNSKNENLKTVIQAIQVMDDIALEKVNIFIAGLEAGRSIMEGAAAADKKLDRDLFS